MANEDVISPRKTMFVLVVVVGCFAVLWPRLLYPLFVGNVRDQLKPNKFDKETEYMRQERSPYLHPTAGPHPAMRERGRAITTPSRTPTSTAASRTPTPPSQGPIPIARRSAEGRVRPQPYTLTDIYHKQDEPIVPGMRPPMGGAGQIVPPPKSATMGLFMPLYTTAVVVFFVYTLTKLLFRKHKPDESPYDFVESDPEFRRRVFQEEGVRQPSSRYTPERPKLVVSAISGLVAEVRQQMEEPKGAQRTDIQQDPINDIQLPQKNGSIHTLKYPVEENNYSDIQSENVQVERPPIKDLVVEEETMLQLELEHADFHHEKYTRPDRESKESTPDMLVSSTTLRETEPEAEYTEEEIIEKREMTPDLEEPSPDLNDWTPIIREPSPIEVSPEPEELVEDDGFDNEIELLQKADVLFREPTPQPNDLVLETKEIVNELQETIPEVEEAKIEEALLEAEEDNLEEILEESKRYMGDDTPIEELIQDEDTRIPASELREDSPIFNEHSPVRQQSPIMLEDDYEHVEIYEEEQRPESPANQQLKANVEKDRATVKVLGMEMTASCSDGTAWGSRPLSSRPPAPPPPRPRSPSPPVSAIFLEGPALPHQSRLLVTDSETHTEGDGDASVVLSGKMTLSVINDESAKSTPERDSEDTVNGVDDDDFVTASAATAPKQVLQDDEEVSEEEVEEEAEEDDEEEVEVEEIEEEEGEELEEEDVKVRKA